MPVAEWSQSNSKEFSFPIASFSELLGWLLHLLIRAAVIFILAFKPGTVGRRGEGLDPCFNHAHVFALFTMFLRDFE